MKKLVFILVLSALVALALIKLFPICDDSSVSLLSQFDSNGCPHGTVYVASDLACEPPK